MSPRETYLSETSTCNGSNTSRTRSASTASSSRTSSSRESSDSARRPRQDSKSPLLRNQKAGSFGRLFGAKEPSLNSFKQLADLQQRELDRKGQKIPFGVPNQKLPSSVKDDYKKAKQRAKENAKLHEAMREKLKLHNEKEAHTHARILSEGIVTMRDDCIHSSNSISPPPMSAQSLGLRFSSLETLPEVAPSAVSTVPTRPAYNASSRSHEHRSTNSQDHGQLTSKSRKEALPWE